MQNTRGQVEQEQREKHKDVANSEKENYPTLIKRTTQKHPRTIIEVEEGSSSATRSEHGSESSTNSGDDDNGSSGLESGGELGVKETSETVVPNTYPQSPQSQHVSRDRGKSLILQQVEEDEEDEREEDEDQQPSSMQTQYLWAIGYPHAYEQYYEQYPPQPQPPSVVPNSYNYFFGYRLPQYEYGYRQYSNNNNNEDDNDEESAKHSFWW